MCIVFGLEFLGCVQVYLAVSSLYFLIAQIAIFRIVVVGICSNNIAFGLQLIAIIRILVLSLAHNASIRIV